MLVAIWAFNNITSYKLLIARCGLPSDSYYYQTTNNFEKHLDQKGVKNTLMITTLIFIIFCMYIRPTRILEDGISNAKFDADGKLRIESTGLD